MYYSNLLGSPTFKKANNSNNFIKWFFSFVVVGIIQERASIKFHLSLLDTENNESAILFPKMLINDIFSFSTVMMFEDLKEG